MQRRCHAAKYNDDISEDHSQNGATDETAVHIPDSKIPAPTEHSDEDAQDRRLSRNVANSGRSRGYQDLGTIVPYI